MKHDRTKMPPDELTELWELLDEGRHQAWPECIELFDEPGYRRCWLYLGNEPTAVSDDEHALAIARDHIEGWLVELGFEIGIEPGSRNYYWYDGSSGEWICTLASEALTEAVRYALNREMNKEANSHKPPYK